MDTTLVWNIWSVCIALCVLACGVGFGVLYMRRYLHISYTQALLRMIVASIMLFALVMYVQNSYDTSLAHTSYAFILSHSILLYIVLLMLCIMAYIDWVYLALPESLLVVFFVLSCVCMLVMSFDVWTHIMNALALMGGTFVMRFLGEIVFQKPLLGEADIVVFGGLGLCFGVLFTLMSVFIASFLALLFMSVRLVVTKSYAQSFPFVSYLFVGVLISYVGNAENLIWALLGNGVWYV
ncbi:prepilin peptidase [Helicobacter sp.]|uniref:prepilin peptidase n=1 Tax=Helicobacter sp. TaxID=218 RepID=UPI003751C4BB|nr:hypothetical protein [Helicobacter sp.]